MVVIISIFLTIFALVWGVYWLFGEREDQRTRERLARQLGGGERSAGFGGPARSPLLIEEARLSDVKLFDTLLSRVTAVSTRLQPFLESADVEITVGRFLLNSLLLGAGTCVVLQWRFGLLTVSAIGALVVALVPTLLVYRKRVARLRRFEEQFPEAIDLLARAMRAGHGLTGALAMVADELEAPVGKEFRLLYDWQNFGMSLPVALQRFADRSPVLDARFFATSVLVQRESGGNLAELLDDLSRVIRERFRVKRQIQVLSAHGRMTGMVLSGMPIALAAYFFITRPEYLSELLTNPMGQKMLIGAAMMQILGTYLISRIVDIEY